MSSKISQSTIWVGIGVVVLVIIAAFGIVTLLNDGATTVSASTADTSTNSEAPLEAAAESEITIFTEDDRSLGLQASTRGWNTNWNRRTIQYDELLSGGPPRDGIASIDEPQFVSQDEAAAWLGDNEPVIALEIAGLDITQ